jgi:sulfoxide reductase heme-binding subunit YedZ
MRAILESRAVLRTLLSIPAVLFVYFYAANAWSYGAFLHASGDWAARLLILTMAVTPIRMGFPRAGISAWLMKRRRDLGVATFGYALLHMLAYVHRKAEMSSILGEAKDPSLWTGWLAFAVFLFLAATSNDASIRLLRRGWKKLHRLVYIGAILTFTHWVLTAFDLVPALIHLAVLALIEAVRVALLLRHRRQRTRLAENA